MGQTTAPLSGNLSGRKHTDGPVRAKSTDGAPGFPMYNIGDKGESPRNHREDVSSAPSSVRTGAFVGGGQGFAQDKQIVASAAARLLTIDAPDTHRCMVPDTHRLKTPSEGSIAGMPSSSITRIRKNSFTDEYDAGMTGTDVLNSLLSELDVFRSHVWKEMQLLRSSNQMLLERVAKVEERFEKRVQERTALVATNVQCLDTELKRDCCNDMTDMAKARAAGADENSPSTLSFADKVIHYGQAKDAEQIDPAWHISDGSTAISANGAAQLGIRSRTDEQHDGLYNFQSPQNTPRQIATPRSLDSGPTQGFRNPNVRLERPVFDKLRWFVASHSMSGQSKDASTKEDSFREDFETLRECILVRGVVTSIQLEGQAKIRRCRRRLFEVCHLPACCLLIMNASGMVNMSAFASACSSVGPLRVALHRRASLQKSAAERITPTAASDKAPSVARRLLHMASFGFLGGSRKEVISVEQTVLSLDETTRLICSAAGATATKHLRTSCTLTKSSIQSMMAAMELGASPVYLCGGRFGMASDCIERLDTRTLVWEVIPPMAICRRACALTSLEGKLYVMGGVDVPRGEPEEHMNPCKYCPECFDPATGAWSFLPPLNWMFIHAAAASSRGFVFVVGGLSFATAMDQVQRYCPADHVWKAMQPMPTPRFECAAAATGGDVYVFGGSSSTGEPYVAAECFTPSVGPVGQWKTLPGMRVARYGCAAVAKGGKLFVFGGHTIGASLALAECFDPSTNDWTSLPDMLMERHRCGAALSAGKIYILGGNSNGKDALQLDCLSSDLQKWTTVAIMPRACGHCIATAVTT